MKIAFSASPKAKHTIGSSLDTIFNYIEELGHHHTIDFVKSVDPSTFYKPGSEEATIFFDQVERSIKTADICIFETTVPSLGLGHVTYMALSLGKPVIALYQGDNAPMLLSEIDDSRVQVMSYTPDTIKEILEQTIDYAKDQADTRFNFFISPGHATYLDWISQHRRVPRSVYLRNLIKRDMENNNDYR